MSIQIVGVDLSLAGIYRSWKRDLRVDEIVSGEHPFQRYWIWRLWPRSTCFSCRGKIPNPEDENDRAEPFTTMRDMEWIHIEDLHRAKQRRCRVCTILFDGLSAILSEIPNDAPQSDRVAVAVDNSMRMSLYRPEYRGYSPWQLRFFSIPGNIR